MSKFVKFYEWLCGAVVPLMLAIITPALILLLKAVLGYGSSDVEFWIIIISIALSHSACFLWLICSLIRNYQFKKEHPDWV